MVTQKDIAKVAKVRQTTVSDVLNNRYGSKRISEEKRAYIKKIAREMGYEIDDMARGIRTGKTKVIGFLCSSSNSNLSTWELLSGISHEAEKHGYIVKLISGRLLKRSSDEEYNKISQLCSRQRLAALILNRFVDDVATRLKSMMAGQETQIALVTNYCNPGNSLHVSSNDAQGIRMAVDHLYELGHRKIAYLSLPLIHPSSVIRRDAFIERTRFYGLETAPEYIIALNYTSVHTEIAQLFKDRKKAPTALVCSGDNIAVRVKDVLAKEHCISTPEDVSITGFGNLECGRVCFPEITTVNEPFEQMGTRIAEKLIAKLEGRDFGRLEEFIDTKLIVRGSTWKNQS